MSQLLLLVFIVVIGVSVYSLRQFLSGFDWGKQVLVVSDVSELVKWMKYAMFGGAFLLIILVVILMTFWNSIFGSRKNDSKKK